MDVSQTCVSPEKIVAGLVDGKIETGNRRVFRSFSYQILGVPVNFPSNHIKWNSPPHLPIKLGTVWGRTGTSVVRGGHVWVWSVDFEVPVFSDKAIPEKSMFSNFDGGIYTFFAKFWEPWKQQNHSLLGSNPLVLRIPISRNTISWQRNITHL